MVPSKVSALFYLNYEYLIKALHTLKIEFSFLKCCLLFFPTEDCMKPKMNSLSPIHLVRVSGGTVLTGTTVLHTEHIHDVTVHVPTSSTTTAHHWHKHQIITLFSVGVFWVSVQEGGEKHHLKPEFWMEFVFCQLPSSVQLCCMRVLWFILNPQTLLMCAHMTRFSAQSQILHFKKWGILL